MSKKKLGIFAFTLTLVILGIVTFEKSTISKATENKMKESVSSFNNVPKDNIEILTQKDESEQNKTFQKLFDGKFYYDVDHSGNILTIAKKQSDNASKTRKYDMQKYKDNAMNILKKINKDKASQDYDISYKETSLTGNQMITYLFREKGDDGGNTGNYVYVDMDFDGELIGASIHNSEDKDTHKKTTQLSEENAKEIFINYLKNHKNLNKYADKISANNYSASKEVFQGTIFWKFSFVIPESEYKDFTFSYYVDSNTGEIKFKSEPKMPGF